MKMNEIENIALEKRNKEHYENLIGWKIKEKWVTMDKKYMQALRLKRDVQGTRKNNFGNTPVHKGSKHDKMKRTWRYDTTFKLNG